MKWILSILASMIFFTGTSYAESLTYVNGVPVFDTVYAPPIDADEGIIWSTAFSPEWHPKYPELPPAMGNQEDGIDALADYTSKGHPQYAIMMNCRVMEYHHKGCVIQTPFGDMTATPYSDPELYYGSVLVIKVFEGTTDGYIYDLVSGQVIHALIDSSAAFN